MGMQTNTVGFRLAITVSVLWLPLGVYVGYPDASKRHFDYFAGDDDGGFAFCSDVDLVSRTNEEIEKCQEEAVGRSMQTRNAEYAEFRESRFVSYAWTLAIAVVPALILLLIAAFYQNIIGMFSGGGSRYVKWLRGEDGGKPDHGQRD